MRVIPVPCRVRHRLMSRSKASSADSLPHFCHRNLVPQSDNYEYLIIDEKVSLTSQRRDPGGSLTAVRVPQTQTTAVVDPFDPAKLQAAAEKEGVKLGQYLLTTHGHHDHAGGNEETVKLCVAVCTSNQTALVPTPGSSVVPLIHPKLCSYPNIKVYAGGEKVSAVTDVVRRRFRSGPRCVPSDSWTSTLPRSSSMATSSRSESSM